MTIAYECLGRDEYRQEERADDPYKRKNYYNNGKIFRDIWTWNVGYQYTPEQLDINVPYPEFYNDASGITYRRIDVKEIDNHAFSQEARQGPRMHTPAITGETFTPFVHEKEHIQDNTGYQQSSTIEELKKKGLLK